MTTFPPVNSVEPNTIVYALRDTSLGHVLMALSPRGVCHLSLGEQAHILEQHLLQKHPHAHHDPAHTELDHWLTQVAAFIERPDHPLQLPLDLRGTPFQIQVWQALQNIPIGTTTTYAIIANRIGSPQAVRAVASACAANPIALAVPCHRVITSNGDLSGYRWGVARKAELLRREAEQHP